jgi:hypothetical protein
MRSPSFKEPEMRTRLQLVSPALGALMLAAVAAAPTATADSMPGFSFYPAKLQDRMDSCMEYQIGPSEILMGWLNVRTGDQRQWRCSSLRHMLLDDEDRPAHDPYENIPDFMRCVDKVVSYGFPRKGDPIRAVGEPDNRPSASACASGASPAARSPSLSFSSRNRGAILLVHT